MAIVNDGFSLTVTLGASNNKVMRVNYELQSADYATAVTDTATILAALGAVSAGAVRGYTISARAVEDAYATPTSDDAEYGEAALLNVQIEDNPFKTANIRIPMPKITIFQNSVGQGRDIVDVLDADVIAYNDLFGTGAEAYISDGEFSDYINSGRRL